MSCVHEETKTPFCPRCGARIALDLPGQLDKKLLQTGESVHIIIDGSVSTDVLKPILKTCGAKNTFRSSKSATVESFKNYQYRLGLQTNISKLTIINANQVTYRELLGYLTYCKISIALRYQDSKTSPLEFDAKFADAVAPFTDGLCYNPGNLWVGTFEEVARELPGIDTIKIAASATTYVNGLQIRHLPVWYDEIRAHIRSLRTAELYAALRA